MLCEKYYHGIYKKNYMMKNMPSNTYLSMIFLSDLYGNPLIIYA